MPLPLCNSTLCFSSSGYKSRVRSMTGSPMEYSVMKDCEVKNPVMGLQIVTLKGIPSRCGWASLPASLAGADVLATEVAR
jgi:hypothetical protein